MPRVAKDITLFMSKEFKSGFSVNMLHETIIKINKFIIDKLKDMENQLINKVHTADKNVINPYKAELTKPKLIIQPNINTTSSVDNIEFSDKLMYKLVNMKLLLFTVFSILILNIYINLVPTLNTINLVEYALDFYTQYLSSCKVNTNDDFIKNPYNVIPEIFETEIEFPPIGAEIEQFFTLNTHITEC